MELLGYSPPKSIYYDILKKIEIQSRTESHPRYKKPKTEIQLKLF